MSVSSRRSGSRALSRLAATRDSAHPTAAQAASELLGRVVEVVSGDTLVVAGSIYLVGEICARLFPEGVPGGGCFQDAV